MPIRLLYDRDCGFCRWSVAELLRLDRHERLDPVAIQSEEGQRLLGSIAPEERLETAHAVDADGRVFSGGDAAPVVAAALPGGGTVARALRFVSLPVGLLYGLVANNRIRVSKCVPAAAKARADERLADVSARRRARAG